MGKDLRDVTRLVYARDGKPTWEDLRFGVQLRIADALERLATGKTELETQKELAGQRKIVSDLSNVVLTKLQEAENLRRSIRAYKGVITKLKKKINRSGLNAHLEAHLKLAKAGK